MIKNVANHDGYLRITFDVAQLQKALGFIETVTKNAADAVHNSIPYIADGISIVAMKESEEQLLAAQQIAEIWRGYCEAVPPQESET